MSQVPLSSKCQTIASYSLFRVLYDANKDVYAVLRKMILFVIESHNIRSIRLSKLADVVYEEFEMSVPQSVLKTVMRRMAPDITRENNIYYVKNELTVDSSLREEIDTANLGITELLEKLYNYVCEDLDRNISEKAKLEIQRSLYRFLMDDNTPSEFLVPISKFVVKNRYNETIKKVKEGILLFQGLKETKGSPSESPFKPLTIFLGMDVLFDLGDLNDSVFTDAIRTLVGYINEINRKGPIIQLKYFSTEKDRIEKYFSSVEYDYNRKSLYKRDDTACHKITKNINSAVDIVERKNELFSIFKKNGILDDYSTILSQEENWVFNHLSKDFCDDYVLYDDGDNQETEINRLFGQLNTINILRKNSPEKEILDAKYIFLTRQKLAKNISQAFLTSNKCKASLVCSVDYLVNILWYKLGKGFGTNLFPSCLSALVDAQVLIASMVKRKVSSEYDRILGECKDGKITPEELIDKTYAIRAIKREPSDISEDAVDQVAALVTDEGFENYLSQTEKIRASLENERERNDGLMKQLQITEDRNSILSDSVNTLTNHILAKLNNDLEVQSRHLERLQGKRTVVLLIGKISSIFLKIVIFCVTILIFYLLSLQIISVNGQEVFGITILSNYNFALSFLLSCFIFLFPYVKRIPGLALNWVSDKIYRCVLFFSKIDTQIKECENKIDGITEELCLVQRSCSITKESD